ncbi:MAG: metal-dependent transcriptional regulator, partial [Gemmatimonadales bacterium]
MADNPMLSRSHEDYLKVIYDLEARFGFAQTSAIAEALDLTPGAVSQMMKRLAGLGLVEHALHRGVRLTDSGCQAALQVLRRHRIIEAYLLEKLGYGWDSVDAEADRLEHAASDELVETMARAMGNPRYDPHGAPIPTSAGDLEQPEVVPMTELSVGAASELRMVNDQDPERLRFLASLGLKPGTRFKVLARQPFHGPLTLQIEGADQREQVVGYELANALACLTPEG